nr:DUF2254 domain-containing protein [Nonlabens marinus]
MPSGIALFFALLAIAMIWLPLESSNLPEFLKGLEVTGKSDVQFILAFIIGGIFTLTIFSYTMVMNVLNRSINNYSPRLIPLILSERNHQLILGFTSGTIIYSMILSIVVACDNTTVFPPLAAGLGVFMSIFCVFLFIYFIHSVSQSIHINYILKKSFDRSTRNLSELTELKKLGRFKEKPADLETWEVIKNSDCGYLQLLEIESLAQKAADAETDIWIDPIPGTFIFEDDILIRTSKALKQNWKKMDKQVSVDSRVPLELNETEIKHLVEVAVKASSPAINDPGTSLASIEYITQLIMNRAKVDLFNSYTINNKNYVYIPVISNEDLTYWCFVEMWNYMKADPILVPALKNSLQKIEGAGVDTSTIILQP